MGTPRQGGGGRGRRGRRLEGTGRRGRVREGKREEEGGGGRRTEEEGEWGTRGRQEEGGGTGRAAHPVVPRLHEADKPVELGGAPAHTALQLGSERCLLGRPRGRLADSFGGSLQRGVAACVLPRCGSSVLPVCPGFHLWLFVAFGLPQPADALDTATVCEEALHPSFVIPCTAEDSHHELFCVF